MGASLTGKRTPLGPYRRPMPRVLGGSWGGGRFLMSEVLVLQALDGRGMVAILVSICTWVQGYLAHKNHPPP